MPRITFESCNLDRSKDSVYRQEGSLRDDTIDCYKHLSTPDSLPRKRGQHIPHNDGIGIRGPRPMTDKCPDFERMAEVFVGIECFGFGQGEGLFVVSF